MTFIKNAYAALRKFVRTHKIWSGVGLIAILAVAYFAYGALTSGNAQTLYVLGTASKNTIVSSVSASGQVAASNEIDLKAKVSGNITWVGVKAGDRVGAGQALISIDDTSAEQSVANAEADLKTAELQFQKDSAQAPIDYQTALDNLATAKDALATAYSDAYNDISTTFLDLPAVASGMQTTLYGYALSSARSQWNVDVLTNMFLNEDRNAVMPFAQKAESDYSVADDAYNASVTDYQALSRSSSTADIEKMLKEAIDTTTDVAQALQSEINFLGEVNDLATKNDQPLPSGFSTLLSDARSYLSTANGDLNSLLTQKKTLDSDRQTVTTDQNNITLLQIGNGTGANPISLQIAAANLEKQKEDLQNLKDTLADYTVTAPFSGSIASITGQRGDQASSASVSLITDNQVATLSLNEVDAAKIKLGDKATLTFDAIDGLTLTGEVAEMDPVGTVSQGVVSYTVKIDFSSQDSRVKPGMTVNAAIQTGVAQDVLTVPSSAVKTAGGMSYVLVFTPPLTDTGGSSGVASAVAPTQVPVTTGLSDDTNVEITSGLSEGEQIVVRTTTASTQTSAAAATSRTGAAGATRGIGGGGNAVFIQRGG
jgi:RND family efflux transporter MFP subunit